MVESRKLEEWRVKNDRPVFDVRVWYSERVANWAAGKSKGQARGLLNLLSVLTASDFHISHPASDDHGIFVIRPSPGHPPSHAFEGAFAT